MCKVRIFSTKKSLYNPSFFIVNVLYELKDDVYVMCVISLLLCLSGQKKIKDSSVLIVGAGGLGCPAALYLSCAGIGHIGIVDYDDVEINNLHRQILYTEADVGVAKVSAAASSINRYDDIAS